MALWQAVAVAVALCHVTGACNVRELGEIIRNRFQQEVVSDCGAAGEKCNFDRDCCIGLECRMAVTKGGVDNYCQTRIEAPAKNLADIPPMPEEAPAAYQPSSDEDGAWMLASLVGSEEHEGPDGVARPTDTLGEIDRLQEKKRAKLFKENQDLERLFTEKEEKELEMLRSLKEDAEVDELRRLKELRLKRKLQLLKEIRELKALQAEEDLNRIDKFKNKTNPKESEATTVTLEKKENVEANETNPIEEDPQQGLEGDTATETQEEPNNKAELAQEPQNDQEPEQTQQPDTSTHKHKQGIHEAHHRRKHHTHKQKHKQTPQLNSSELVENTEALSNAGVATQGSNA